ncbi:ATP-binding protein [Streptomyces chrestomyceticus]|uniref:ATP-binding protein n=1 Tax=Streptomyces chrestomyceticus TaxID=68185 RepID=UPI0033CF043D
MEGVVRMYGATGGLKAARFSLVPVGNMTLYPVPESASRARRWFRKFMQSEGLACSMDDCTLLISELVANAVQHGEAETPWRIRVEWARVGDALWVDVHSAGHPSKVRMQEPGLGETHGRGLRLVHALADFWLVGASPYGGTRVAFVLDAAWSAEEP